MFLSHRMVSSVKHDADRFGIPWDKFVSFEKLVVMLEKRLLSGMIFQVWYLVCFSKVADW